MNRPTLLAVGWTLMILALCTVPGVDLPLQGISLDKLVHLLLFIGFGFLWLRATDHPWKYLWVLLGGIAFGVGTEFYQGLLPWERTPDPYDALANVVGTLVGLGLYAALNRRQAG